jgi:hypothetical protein
MLGFLFGRPRPYRTALELAEAMVAAMRARPGVSSVEVSPDDPLQMKVVRAASDSIDVNLHNAVAHLLGHRLSRAEQDHDIARFLASITDRPSDVELIVGNLMPCVRHTGYVEAMFAAWGDHPERESACRPLNGDLCVVLMQDLGESYASTSPDMFERAGISPAEGAREAAANFARLVGTRQIERFGDGVWLVRLAGEELMSISLLAFPDHLDTLQRELGLGEALMAAPTRDAVLIGRPVQQQVLRNYIKRSQNEGHLQSACIFGRALGQPNLGYVEHFDGTTFVTAEGPSPG